MEAMEAIISRRSIRKYTPDSVTEGEIHELLAAAMSAPSSSNGQPWHFVTITDRQTLDEIPQFHPYSNMIKDAPLAVVVCGDLQLEKGKGVWVQDCSAATENLLVAAQAMGLGAVWLGVYPIEERINGIRNCSVYRRMSCRFASLLSGIRRKRSPRPTGLILSGCTGTSGNGGG